MKFLFKCLFVFSVIYFILSFVIYLLDDGHEVGYSVGNYSIKEIYKSSDNEYFFSLNGDSNFSFKVNYDYKKSEKILSKLYFKKFDGYKCFLPVFKGGKILTDVLCLKGDTVYHGDDLDNESIYNYFKKYGYNHSLYKDTASEIVVSPTLTFYKNNLSNSDYLGMESYNGLILFNSKEGNVKLFDRDVYKKPISLFFDKYYLVADYGSEYSFNSFYLVNIVNGEKRIIRSYDDISFDSYIMGYLDDKVYLFDRENKKQYYIDIKTDDVIMTGDKDSIKYYNGNWTTISLKDALSFRKFEYKSDIKGYDRVDFYKNYYLFKKNDDVYDVYMMDERDKNIKTLLFKTSDISSIVYLNDKIYFKRGNDFCFYGNRGIRKVLNNTEFEFNDDILLGVYKK